MDKCLGQLLIGAVLGAVAVEVLRKKKPKILDEIKSNAKDIIKNLKDIYKQVNEAIKSSVENAT